MGQKNAVWILISWFGAWLGVRALGFACELYPAKIDEALWLRWMRALGWHPIAGSLGGALIGWALMGHRHSRGDSDPAAGEDSLPVLARASHPPFQQL
jgi:hypothetical protein